MFVIVMGVTGSGKSTVGQSLANRLQLPFHDADAYHSPESREKMARDIPLSDADRWPWLERLSALAVSWERQGGAVLACSALKQAYRDVLVRHVAGARVVYLPKDAITLNAQLPPAEIVERAAALLLAPH